MELDIFTIIQIEMDYIERLYNISMDNFKYKLRYYLTRLYERSYGMDDLNKYLIFSSIALSFINFILKSSIVLFISMIFYGLFLFRFFSRNKIARRIENRRTMHYIKYLKLSFENRRTHKIFICKNCETFIRVPKGKGKIEYTCPKCGSVYENRT